MAKLLLVEDFPIIQDLYREPLEKAGYTVDTATDGAIALKKVADQEYDVILLDMLLPTINGIEFLEKYKNRPASTLIVALSDFNEPGRMRRAKELGVRDYLIKADNPPSRLIERLAVLLAGETKPQAE